MTYYERNLPHWQPEGKALFVTWRLWRSLPAGLRGKAMYRPRETGSIPANVRGQARSRRSSAGEQFVAMDRQLDRADSGPRWLADPRVAAAVVATLRRGAEILHHYRLDSFVVMPNHVHVLIEPLIEPVQALKGVKGTAARAANRILDRTGRPFWQDESFDRWVRNPKEFERIRAYIERNPVTAGLAHNPEDWPWSSACLR